MPMKQILIAGGGPAGAAAAISGRLEGSPVRLIERATTARHKVCGEFISPGACEILEALHAGDEFRALAPYRIRRCTLHLGNRTKQWRLQETAWGLSRLQLDRLLLDKAAALGAVVERGEAFEGRPKDFQGCVIVACGRTQPPERGDRLFGFKAHFEGPADDAIELFFDHEGYIGVGCVEDGLTNVCGIARESILRKYGFDFDAVAARSNVLSERIRPLQRRMRWIVTGPLSFSTPSHFGSGPDVYAAGDSLGFVDPFTGSGILNGLLTGRLAGIAAARQTASSEYLRECRARLARPFFVSSILRRLIGRTDVHWLAPLLPGQVLFRWTRAGRADGTQL
jgi:flavin-dependent dehydrogenase